MPTTPQGARPPVPAAERTTAPLQTLHGRKALVVGGSGGIGSRVSEELAARGAAVTVHGAHREKIDKAVARIIADGGRADGLEWRLETGNIAEFTALVTERIPPDILVVAFGPFLRKTLAETDPRDWERLALLDLALPGALASACLGPMCRRGWGRMLFFGGTRTDGIRAYRSNAAYAAAKTGLGVLVKSLAAEGTERGVAALAVCPGLVDTEYLDEGGRAALASMAPGGALLDPQGIARSAVDLLAAEPCAVNGAVISMDAGFRPR